MTTLITPGPVRLAVLNGVGGAKLKTLYLPTPDKNYPELEWAEKKVDADLVDGSERTRILGYLPVLKLRWTPYEDRAVFGFTLGTSDGNRPTVDQLLDILSSDPGTLKVSLGGGASPFGFVVGRVNIDKIPYKGGQFVSLTLTLRGRDVVSSRVLGAF